MVERLLLITALAALLSLPSWAAKPRSDLVSTSEPRPLTVRAQLVPRLDTTLSAPMTGRLTAFPVREGRQVEKGTKLARFDCEAERAERAVASARLDAARAQRQVNERLAEMRNVSALDVKLSKSEEAMAKAELRRIAAQLKRCELAAPFSGEVVEAFVSAHQYVKVGEPLLRLVDPTSVEAEMVLPSTVLSWLRPGHWAVLALDELGMELVLEVERIIGEVDPVSQTVRVTAKLPTNAPATLLPGMSGGVRIERSDEPPR